LISGQQETIEQTLVNFCYISLQYMSTLMYDSVFAIFSGHLFEII